VRVRFVFGSITDDRILAGLDEDLDYVFHLPVITATSLRLPTRLPTTTTIPIPRSSSSTASRTSRDCRRSSTPAAACAVAEKTYDAPTATTEEQPVTLYHDSPYSISKIIGELYGNYYFQRYGLPFVKARFSNVYGPREILGAGQWRGTVHTVWRNVTPTFIWRALHGEALPLDNGGNASRDFIFVEDMARGLMACALHGCAGGVYNLATGCETSILELATIINEYTGNTTPLDLRPARDWDRSGKRFASTEKAARELGFSAQVNIRDGLRRTVEWTRANRELIQRSIARHDKLMTQAGA
jgi:UDP-glucose 4-epimerase